jgi:hypothetical protein
VYKGANNIYLPMFEWKFKMNTKDIYLILKVPIYPNIVYSLLLYCSDFLWQVLLYCEKKKVGKCRFLVLKKDTMLNPKEIVEGNYFFVKGNCGLKRLCIVLVPIKILRYLTLNLLYYTQIEFME